VPPRNREPKEGDGVQYQVRLSKDSREWQTTIENAEPIVEEQVFEAAGEFWTARIVADTVITAEWFGELGPGAH
jgi:hypothetical protein